jgi:hypothetical protein
MSYMNVKTVYTAVALSLLVSQLSWAQSTPPPGPIDEDYPSLFTPVPDNFRPGSNAPVPQDCLTESEAAKGSRLSQMEAGRRMIEVTDWESGMQALDNYMNAGAAAFRQERVADDVCSRNRTDFIRYY